MSINTFEDLFEEVKKLYPEATIGGEYRNEIEYSNDRYNYQVLHHNKTYYLEVIEDGWYRSFYDSKDPNKILKLIKNLKELGDE